MSRGLVLAGLMAASVAVGGCAFSFGREEETTTAGSLDRAERARSEADRMHPACRDSRADRDDQPEGCETVVRRDR
ncbi:hypothetical protein [Brevundimonas sp.]|uniref:hypothetical protein n=1 Tax=Brevundimonas sp. TaxID=1871086 RepID=UPI002D25CDFA|nr:hypothetical protein [Brevundimonas sp.]HYC99317.1 hypothetical protein [Brevundimonas sp.]